MLQSHGHELTQVGVKDELKLVEPFLSDVSYTDLVWLVQDCGVWIDIDSFLQHLGWSIGKPGIAIFGKSDPLIFGHAENMNLLKSRTNLRVNQFAPWEDEFYDPAVFVDPLRAFAEIIQLMNQLVVRVA
jgi:ADP-heptose:LPS heptosyltransferase